MGHSPLGENEVSESIEASSGLKRQRYPLRQPRLQTANRKKTAITGKTKKPGSVGKSTLPGVEVAGFRFAPQSQSSHCSLGAVALLVSIDSFASLRFQRRPTGATFGSLTRGLLVPKSRIRFFSRQFRILPGFAGVLPFKALFFRKCPVLSCRF